MADDPRFRVVLAAGLAAMGSPSAFAQELVTNGHFATDTAGWTAETSAAPGSAASAGHTLGDGSPTAGAAVLGGSQQLNGGTNASLTQCVALAGVPLPWTLGGRTRLALSDSGFGSCGVFFSIRVFLYPSANCAGSAVVVNSTPQGTAPGVVGPFTLYGAHIMTDPHLATGGTQSAAIALFCGVGCSNKDSGGGAVHFDSLSFGYIPAIFANGFESL